MGTTREVHTRIYTQVEISLSYQDNAVQYLQGMNAVLNLLQTVIIFQMNCINKKTLRRFMRPRKKESYVCQAATFKIEKQKEKVLNHFCMTGETWENSVFLLLNFEILPAMPALSEEGPFLFQPLQVPVTHSIKMF